MHHTIVFKNSLLKKILVELLKLYVVKRILLNSILFFRKILIWGLKKFYIFFLFFYKIFSKLNDLKEHINGILVKITTNKNSVW